MGAVMPGAVRIMPPADPRKNCGYQQKCWSEALHANAYRPLDPHTTGKQLFLRGPPCRRGIRMPGDSSSSAASRPVMRYSGRYENSPEGRQRRPGFVEDMGKPVLAG